METAAIKGSLDAVTGFDSPSLTRRMVSPRWYNRSRINGLMRWVASSANTAPDINALLVDADVRQACNGARFSCTIADQYFCSFPKVCRLLKGTAIVSKSPRTILLTHYVRLLLQAILVDLHQQNDPVLRQTYKTEGGQWFDLIVESDH